MTEPSLLSRIAAGDERAVKECIDRYSGLVWTIARRLIPNPDEIEDAVQEVFIELWKSAARFDASLSAEKTFVVMVARRRFIDRLRKHKRQPDIQPLPETVELANQDHEDMERDAEASMAVRFLTELKPEQRKVLELSIYQGMSHGEISEAIDMPLGTVKSHIRRGLTQVRERLATATAEAEGRRSS